MTSVDLASHHMTLGRTALLSMPVRLALLVNGHGALRRHSVGSCAALALARKKRGFCFARAARPVGVLPTERKRHDR